MRVGRAIAKTEEEGALELMKQLKERGHPDAPPAIATDGRGGYRAAMVETWGKVPEYEGVGRPAELKQPQEGWQYLQVVKEHSGSRLVSVTTKVVYGEATEVTDLLSTGTQYVERTNLTSRQMNGRLVRKTLSFSKQLEALKAASAWEDWVYNLTRTVRTLRVEVNDGQRRWRPHTPAMAAGLSDHAWTIREVLTTVVAPLPHQH